MRRDEGRRDEGRRDEARADGHAVPHVDGADREDQVGDELVAEPGDRVGPRRVVDAATGRTACGVAATDVRFGTPSDAEVAAYVATGEPLHVAGAFTLDGRSAPFVDGIDGDPGNVIGLSLPLLRTLLAELDVALTDLWAS